MKPQFQLRFMRVEEAHRVAELVRDLQAYQKMKHCPRLPTGEDLTRELTHRNPNGEFEPNNLGTFTSVAVDKSREAASKIVGYMIYTQSYSILDGRKFFVNSFFIEADYRRHGLGRKFIDFIKAHARLVGIPGCDVPFMNDNHIGQKFYKNFGSYLVNEEYFLMAKEHDF